MVKKVAKKRLKSDEGHRVDPVPAGTLGNLRKHITAPRDVDGKVKN